MNHKILFSLFFTFLFLSNTQAAIPAEWPEALVTAAKPLMNMEMKQNCLSFEESGLQLLDCQFYTAKPDKKYGRVVLFDIGLEQWMVWIWTACEKINQTNSRCFQKTASQIRTQSGGQIPWRGVIYEDIKPRDGINEMYCFRYGISVAIKGLTRWLTRQPTTDEIKKCFEADDDEIYFIGQFPRPISLSVKDYQKITGEQGLTDSSGQSTLLWLQRIAQILPEGIGEENLVFVDMWTKLNVKKPVK